MVTPDERKAARIDAEAVVWLDRLHGPDRTPETEAGLQDWLRLDDAHKRAFERATSLWDLLPGAESVRAARYEIEERHQRRRPVWAAVAGIAAAIAITVGGYQFWREAPPSYETVVGQQQVMTLEDGSRIALNTNTRLTVLYSATERRVQLDHGEAMFDVAHNPRRPFIVAAGNEEVRALGTSFVVRSDTGRLAVTLLQGRVAVSRSGSDPRPIAVLSPGQRIIVAQTAASTATAPAIDRPALNAVTAWRRGEAMFDGTPLADAVAELNRYGPTQIVVADPAVGNLRVSGVFATNDAAEFASAIAQLNGLHVRRTGDRIVLER